MNQWNPNDYQQHSSQQQKWAKEVLPRLHLKGNERILDIGCGDGKITAEVARHVPQGSVVGLDASAEMIDFADKQYSTISNLRFEQGDAQSLAFDGQFDWVISFACLHWVIDHRPVLRGICRALRPGGRILLQFGGKGNAAEVVRVVIRSDCSSTSGLTISPTSRSPGVSTAQTNTALGWKRLDSPLLIWHWCRRT